MNKKSKLLAGLMAAVVALSVMAFGFSQWTTDVNLNGSVSAKGNWDIKVTAADLKVSNGAEIGTDSGIRTIDTFEDGTVYVNSFKPASDLKAKIEELKADGAEIIDSSVLTKYRISNGNNVIGIYDTVEETNELKATTPWTRRDTVWGYTITYKDTNTVITNATFTDTEANYAPVAFSLPGAWAEYSVTVTNNGTANANLSDYQFNVSKLDDIYSVDTPSLDGEILKPNESCTFTFVVKVDEKKAGDSFEVDSQNFKVSLTYVQEAVEEAPSASHSH